MKMFAFGFVLMIVFIFVGLWLIGFYQAMRKNIRDEKNEKGQMTLVLISGLVVIGFLMIFLLGPWTQISRGNVGVVNIMGKVDPVPLTSGFHFVNPLADVEEMSTQLQIQGAPYEAASKDLQHVKVMMTLNYQIDPLKAPAIYQDIGDEQEVIYAKVVVPAASEVLKQQISLYNASELLKEREKIKHTVQTNIDTWLKKYGIIVREVSLSDISFSQEYQKAIEAKQLEEQNALKMDYQLLQAKIQANIVTTKAKGEADALILRGTAEAQYNDKVATSLSSSLLAKMYYEKWNGTLPQMVMGSESQTLIQVPSNLSR